MMINAFDIIMTTLVCEFQIRIEKLKQFEHVQLWMEKKNTKYE